MARELYDPKLLTADAKAILAVSADDTRKGYAYIVCFKSLMNEMQDVPRRKFLS